MPTADSTAAAQLALHRARLVFPPCASAASGACPLHRNIPVNTATANLPPLWPLANLGLKYLAFHVALLIRCV